MVLTFYPVSEHFFSCSQKDRKVLLYRFAVLFHGRVAGLVDVIENLVRDEHPVPFAPIPHAKHCAFWSCSNILAVLQLDVAQPNACTSTVLRDERDPRCFKRAFDYGQIAAYWQTHVTLEIRDRRTCNLRVQRQLLLAPIQERASSATLGSGN